MELALVPVVLYLVGALISFVRAVGYNTKQEASAEDLLLFALLWPLLWLDNLTD